MPTYRTLEAVSLVKDGAVVSVKKDREIELTADEAKQVAGRVVLLEDNVVSMFPDGRPVIAQHIVRDHPARRIAGVPVEAEPEKVAPPVAPAVKAAPKADAKAADAK